MTGVLIDKYYENKRNTKIEIRNVYSKVAHVHKNINYNINTAWCLSFTIIFTTQAHYINMYTHFALIYMHT